MLTVTSAFNFIFSFSFVVSLEACSASLCLVFDTNTTAGGQRRHEVPGEW